MGLLSEELYRAEKEIKRFHSGDMYCGIDPNRKIIAMKYKSKRQNRNWITRLLDKLKQM
ncbi:hypothetical protein D3C77_707270 [compost metagenome]